MADVKTIVKAIADGRVVPFLGAGVNLCSRPEGQRWEPGYLPNGRELASFILSELGISSPDTVDFTCSNCDSKHSVSIPPELLRVAQAVDVQLGSARLYEQLRGLFIRRYQSTAVHSFLASLPAVLKAKGISGKNGDESKPSQLIVTTNYDDVLEDAFRDAHESFDVVTYIADGGDRGKFRYYPFEGAPCTIDRPNECTEVDADRRTVILKVHGAVDREKEERDSYVITEDNYINYVAQGDLESFLPIKLANKLKRNHLLFFGYSLHDWNLRVILNKIWSERPRTINSWAVQRAPDRSDVEYWLANYRLEIIDSDLDSYVQRLRQAVDALPRSGATLNA